MSAKPLLREGASEMHYVRVSESERGRVRDGWGWGANREAFRRGAPRLHPYVMTFTSPIGGCPSMTGAIWWLLGWWVSILT